MSDLYQLNDNVAVEYTLETVDHSFDHAFGRRTIKSKEVRNMSLIVWVDGIDYTISEPQIPVTLHSYLEAKILSECCSEA
jgi:hypothetical protein